MSANRIPESKYLKKPCLNCNGPMLEVWHKSPSERKLRNEAKVYCCRKCRTEHTPKHRPKQQSIMDQFLYGVRHG